MRSRTEAMRRYALLTGVSRLSSARDAYLTRLRDEATLLLIDALQRLNDRTDGSVERLLWTLPKHP